jgi:rhodanese-related sulfurtransferase/rubrerythrin
VDTPLILYEQTIMSWKSLFTSGRNMSAAEARSFMQHHRAGEYQLLDVRQLKEYEQSHVPGAIHIPVLDLLAWVTELDPQIPALAYCHNGLRSRAACQVLRGRGFPEVINITGGIRAWNGLLLSGQETMGMEFFVSDEFEDVLLMAYMMEAGLKQFYLAMADMVDKKEQKALLRYMADFEDGHMAKLLRQYQLEMPDLTNAENVSAMEGGFDKDKTLRAYRGYLESMEDIIQLGMMLETQAYDLYSRLARENDKPELREFYRHMADEEKAHLGQLSRSLDQILAGQPLGQPQVSAEAL